MDVTEKTYKQIDEIASKLNLSAEEKSEFIDKLNDEAAILANQASSSEAAEAAFLDYLYQNYRDQIVGTSAEKEALALKSNAPSEEISLVSKPSDEAFMKALGAKNMKQLLDWNWHNHWSKMPYSDLKARVEQAGLDPKSVLAWLQRQQTAYDRGEALEGRGSIGDWLVSAGLGFALPRTKEALKAGREPNAGDWGVDVAALGLQALPLGAVALPVKLGGKVTSYALANAGVPYAEEALDAAFNDDPYRKEFSNTDALVGTGVNIATPAALKAGAQLVAQKLAGFGKSPKIANAIEDFVSDPIIENKYTLNNALDAVERGMSPTGNVMLDPKKTYVSPEEYEKALDLLVLKLFKEKGGIVPEMADSELRQKLIAKTREDAKAKLIEAIKKAEKKADENPKELERLLDQLVGDNNMKYALRDAGGDPPITHFDNLDIAEGKSKLAKRAEDLNPSFSSVYYMSKSGLPSETPDVLKQFGTVMVNGKPRPAIFDPSLRKLGLEKYTSPEYVKAFKDKHGWDPSGRHFASKRLTAAEQYKKAKPTSEGSDIFRDPTDWDEAISTALEDPKTKNFLLYGDKYKLKDLARLGTISLGTNKLGRGENVKQIPDVGPQLYELMKQKTAKNEAEKAEIEYYLNDPVTLRLWEFNYDKKKNFQPRGSNTMRQAYEIWKAQKEQK